MSQDGYPDSPYGFTCRAGHQIQRANGYCSQCAKCEICHKPLTVVEYDWTLQQAARLDEPPDFRHPGCFKEAEKLTLSNESVSIPRALFDRLNASRLLIDPDTDKIGGESYLNQRIVEQSGDLNMQRWIHESSQNRTFEEHQEYLYLQLRKMESGCATLSLAVSKFRRAIEAGLADRDTRLKSKAATERKQHEQKAPHTFKAKLSKEAAKEEKHITFLMDKLGMSKEDALASVESARVAKTARSTTKTNEDTPTNAIN